MREKVHADGGAGGGAKKDGGGGKGGKTQTIPITAGPSAATAPSPQSSNRPPRPSPPQPTTLSTSPPFTSSPLPSPPFTSTSTSSTTTPTPSPLSSSSSPPIPRPDSFRPRLVYDNPAKKRKHDKKSMISRVEAAKAVPLFSHLPQYEKETSLSLKVGFLASDIPAPILRLGLQYTNGDITGSNARCVAMLLAFERVIKGFTVEPNRIFRDDLLQRMKPWVRFLSDCRPLSVSMGNAIRFLKLHISQISPHEDEERARRLVCEDIRGFIRGRITLADEVIVSSAVERISDGDLILTYASSHVVERVLVEAHRQGKRFTVVVVDSVPKREGQRLLSTLTALRIPCHYTLVSTLSSIISSVSLVFIGAYAMLSNGACVSRCGTAVVCLVAHRAHIPVLVCCETYKFVDRVQLDAICSNELADPDELVVGGVEVSGGGGGSGSGGGGGGGGVGGGGAVLKGWRDVKALRLLNLVYDLTPVQFVSMVITEVGNIPPTSMAVILREYYNEHGDIVE